MTDAVEKPGSEPGMATGSKMELVQHASAAMPSEGEMLTAYNAIWQAAPGIDAHNVDIVRREAITAVRALFAPILAEKERERDEARADMVKLMQDGKPSDK